LVCLEENRALFVRRLEEEKVCRQSVVGLNFDDVAHLQVHALFHLELSPGEDPVLPRIGLKVAGVALVVVIALLEHGEREHEEEGGEVSEEQAHLEEGHRLAETQQQVKKVEKVLELLKQHFRHEAHRAVLLVANQVLLALQLRLHPHPTLLRG
jgi:hypothetical protein